MNKFDAIQILNIPRVIKKAYAIAASKYHPDRNPDGLKMMQLVNEAYETLKDFDANPTVIISDSIELRKYIQLHHNTQRSFADIQGVAPCQVSQWMKKQFIVVDTVMYSPRRKLK